MNAPTNPWRLVAAREVQVRVRDKAFIASFAVMLVILALSFGLSALLGDRTETVKVAVSSPGSVTLVQQAGKAASAEDDKLKIEPQRVADSSAVTEAVRSEKADLGLSGTGPATTLIGLKDTDGDAVRYLQQAFATSRLSANAQAAGTDLSALTQGSALSTRTLDTSAVSDLAKQLTGMVFGFLFFFAAILFGSAIAQSVVAEKENRIVEILAGLVPIRQLLIGKIAGNTVLAMAQLVVFALVGVVGLKVAGFDDMVPSVGSAAAWFLAFFLVGFLALAALFAAAGAMATRNEDLQSTQNPVLAILAIVLFAGIYLPEGAQRIGSFVPMVNIVSMPTRLIGGDVAWWEPVLSLLILAVTVVLLVRLAEGIYRRSLMQTGGRLTLRQALRARG